MCTLRFIPVAKSVDPVAKSALLPSVSSLLSVDLPMCTTLITVIMDERGTTVHILFVVAQTTDPRPPVPHNVDIL